MPTDQRYRRNPAVELRKDGDTAVALHVDTGQYYELNASAAFIWESLDGSPTVDTLTANVVGRFAIDEAEARSMIVELLRTLERDGLVQCEGERSGVLRRLLRR